MLVTDDNWTAGVAGLRRAEFPLLQKTTYLDNCSLGSMSNLSHHAMTSYAAQCDNFGAASWFIPGGFLDILDTMRGDIAALIGAQKHEIGLAPNVSVALNSLTSALLDPRDRVITTDLDFPSLVLGLRAKQRTGIDVDVLGSPDGSSIPCEALEQALRRPAKLVATSRVFYGSGAVQDVGKVASLAHDQGALVLVDDYQATGQLPIDVREAGIDLLVGGSLKWLCGGAACAFYYVREDLIEKLHPTVAGWFGVEDQLEFNARSINWRSDARRFELGTPSLISVALASAGLQMINEVGVPAIRKQNIALISYLTEVMTAAGYRPRISTSAAEHSALVLVDINPRPDLDDLVLRLRTDYGVIVDARNGALRISPHFYNEFSDIDRLAAAIEDCMNSHYIPAGNKLCARTATAEVFG
jgi:kynureninase